MSPVEVLIYTIYALAVILPLLPGLLELRSASDDDALRIDSAYARDPRFLGKSMRSKLIPIMQETEGENRVPFLNRKNEFARVVDRLDSGERSNIEDVVLSRDTLTIGKNSALLDAYARGAVSVGDGTRLRTLAADNDAEFGAQTQVIRWIDVEGNCTIGPGSELGQSVSASGRVLLGNDVTFSRLFGRPIAVEDEHRSGLRGLAMGPLKESHADDRLMAKSVYVDHGQLYDVDIVAAGDVEVGGDACVTGSIKAGGTVTIRENATVLGNVVARGDVVLENDSSVFGHIFGDRDVILNAGALVGDRHAPKTLRASGRAKVSTGACVFGWLIAERGGTTVRSLMMLAMIICAAGGIARADQLTTTTTVNTFSSAGSLYGPWQTETMEYQWQAGQKDIPSITLLNRNDRDRNILNTTVPSRSTAVYADDYHNWSSRFFTYAQVMTSDGNILPNRLIYIEADGKFGRQHNIVVGAGASEYANPDGSYTRSLSLGPTAYIHDMVYTVRYLPADVTGTFSGTNENLPIVGTTKAYGSAFEFVAEYNRLGSNQIIATYLAGHQPGLIVGAVGALTPGEFTNIQRISEFDLSINHWFRKDFGIVVGGTLASHAQAASGSNIYDVTALTVGLFVGRAIGLPR